MNNTPDVEVTGVPQLVDALCRGAILAGLDARRTVAALVQDSASADPAVARKASQRLDVKWRTAEPQLRDAERPLFITRATPQNLATKYRLILTWEPFDARTAQIAHTFRQQILARWGFDAFLAEGEVRVRAALTEDPSDDYVLPADINEDTLTR